MRWAAVAALTLLAAACGTGEQLSIQERGLIACEAWAASFDKVTTRRELGLATPQEIILVNRHRPFLNGICLDGQPIDGETTITRLESVLLAIVIARKEEE